jgi:hypothetical protein
MRGNHRNLAILDRDVHHGVDVVLIVENMPTLKEKVIGRKGGLRESPRSYKERDCCATRGNGFSAERLRHESPIYARVARVKRATKIEFAQRAGLPCD